MSTIPGELQSTKEAAPRLDSYLEEWVAGLSDHGFREEDMARVRDKLAQLCLAGVEPMPHLLDPILEDSERVHSVSGYARCCVGLLVSKIDRWATGRVARTAAGPARPDPVMARLERQEAEEAAALEHMAEFDLLRRIRCPACGEGIEPLVEQSVPEERLSAEARDLLKRVRRVLRRGDAVVSMWSRLRCRCDQAPWKAGYLQVQMFHPRARRFILLPEGWEAAPFDGGKSMQPTSSRQASAEPPDGDPSFSEDEFLDSLDR